MKLTRRDFLRLTGVAGAAALSSGLGSAGQDIVCRLSHIALLAR
jgi:TAT (twin-arginine translocation) pathway signal sequence